MSTGKAAFRIGRRIGKHPVASVLFCLTERLLPVKRIARTPGLVAFHHPRPVADPHILIVPTRPFPALTTDRLTTREKAGIVWQMTQLAREIMPHGNYQFVINGGERQDIGQVHAHLLKEESGIAAGARALMDPATEPEQWEELFADLQNAAEIPGNGFSLEIHWNEGSDPGATISQTHSRR